MTGDGRKQKSYLVTVFAVLWLVTAALVYVSIGDAAARLEWWHRLAIAGLAPFAMALVFFVFMFAWHLLFDELPRKVRRWWIGPPWVTPRSVFPFSSKQEAVDHAALKERLTLLDEDVEARKKFYVDTATGQMWCGLYFEQGFESGEWFSPIDEMPNQKQDD